MSEFNYSKFQSQLALPFLETKNEFLEEIFEILSKNFGLKKKSSQKFIDLGSGDGRVVIFIATHYSIKSIGVEIDSNLINDSNVSLKSLKRNNVYKRRVLNKIKFIEADFFTLNLKNYDFIYTYSLPTMQVYLRHLIKTAKPRAIIISHKYKLGQFKPLLKFEWKLNHESDNKKKLVSTYFYSLIISD